jgi:parallel beta-helix repeat protein
MARNLVVSRDRPGSVPTIREALETVARGGVIAIAPGEYAESVIFDNVDVTLVAVDGPGTVVLAASHPSDAVLRIRSGTVGLTDITVMGVYGPAVVADGGTLRMRGCRTSGEYSVGVQALSGAVIELETCEITRAQCGLSLEGCSGTVTGCTVSEIGGDGIIVTLGADPIIKDTVVRDCDIRGIYIYQYGKPTIENCEISGTGQEGISVAHLSKPVIRGTGVHDTGAAGIAVTSGCGGVLDGCIAGDGGMRIEPGATIDVIEAPGLARVGVGAGGSAGGAERVESLLADLESLIGLARVKAEVRSLIDEMQVAEWRRVAGLGSSGVSRHLIFAGAPGTGKTTVARIYGKLLFALGVLPKDTLMEVSRRDLVGQYIGHTAEKTATVINAAMGGVLFIDEAYTLSRSAGANADFGQESIDTIVKMMEDHRDEVAVIAAGYTGDMVQFLSANAGLASRFTRTIEFDSYSADELCLILGRIAHTDSYLLPDEVMEVVRDHFAGIDRGPNFGNAREARTLFEGVRKAQAQRLRALGRMPGRDDLRSIALEDVRVAVAAR